MKQLTLLTLLLTFTFSDNLTIYNNNLANIETKYNFLVDGKVEKKEFANFPNTIITDSIFANFSKNIKLLEQSFNPNRASLSNLLKLNLNQNIKFYPNRSKELKDGTLVNIDPITVKADNSYYILDDASQIVYKIYPKNSNYASIIWKIKSTKKAKESATINYLANSFNWHTNYIISIKDKSLDLKAFATIINKSGKDFIDANVSLIAAKLNRQSAYPRALRKAATPMLEMQAEVIKPKSIEGYYRFKVPFRVDLLNQESKQIALIDAKDIKFKSYGLAYNSNFSNYGKQKLNFARHISFENKKENNLGLILPSGVVRVYKNGTYLGENSIQNTPKNEKIDFALGTLFDAVGEKRIIEYVSKEKYKFIKTKYILKNQGKNKLILKIKESIPRYGNKIEYKTTCKDICTKQDESAFVRVYTITLNPNIKYSFESSFEVSY